MGDNYGSHGNNWQVKRVVSNTGTSGTAMAEAIEAANSTEGQTTVLWQSSGHQGWYLHLHDNIMQLKRTNMKLIKHLTQMVGVMARATGRHLSN